MEVKKASMWYVNSYKQLQKKHFWTQLLMVRYFILYKCTYIIMLYCQTQHMAQSNAKAEQLETA